MQSPPNSTPLHPYSIQGGRMQYTCATPHQPVVSNGSTAQQLNSPPAANNNNNEQSTLHTSPVSSCSASSPIGSSTNVPVSPSGNNTSLNASSSSNSTSPSCDRSHQTGNESQPCHEKTTYHTLAQITPLTVPSTEYPIPPLTPFAINQCYDILDDYTPIYSVL